VVFPFNGGTPLHVCFESCEERSALGTMDPIFFHHSVHSVIWQMLGQRGCSRSVLRKQMASGFLVSWLIGQINAGVKDGFKRTKTKSLVASEFKKMNLNRS